MAKSENKTVPQPAEPAAFLAAVADASQREDALWLNELMTRLSGEPPVMWGPSIVGYGRYHYRYDSGREGDMCRIGFSPRKGQTVVYLVDGFEERQDLLAALGPHKIGKSCLYIKSLNKVDRGVLETLVANSLTEMARRYPL